MPLRLPLAWQRLGKAGQISSRVANRKTQQGIGMAEVSDGKIMRSAGVMHCEMSRGITSAAHPAWPRLVGRGEKALLALLQSGQFRLCFCLWFRVSENAIFRGRYLPLARGGFGEHGKRRYTRFFALYTTYGDT